MSNEMLSCKRHVESALVAAAAGRGSDLAWIEREREVMAMAANEWALAHGFLARVTVSEVERIEPLALGHVDYASKMALHLAEFVMGAS